MYYGIDPFFGQEVLVWAPNRGHPESDLRHALDLIERAHNLHHDRAKVVEALQQAGYDYINIIR
jgi:hypothetical protein